MKKRAFALLCATGLLLVGCSKGTPEETPLPTAEAAPFCDVLDSRNTSYNELFDENPMSVEEMARYSGWAESLNSYSPEALTADVAAYTEPAMRAAEYQSFEIDAIAWTSAHNSINQHCIQERADQVD